jgi:DNA-binding beta-propeller fold protein YncE
MNFASIAGQPILAEHVANIIKYDEKNHKISAFLSYGKTRGQLNNHHGIAVDKADNIYVADTDNNRIQKFDKDGNYHKNIGGTEVGYGIYEFNLCCRYL